MSACLQSLLQLGHLDLGCPGTAITVTMVWEWALSGQVGVGFHPSSAPHGPNQVSNPCPWP